MQNPKIIKIVLNGKCPHCKKEIIVSSKVNSPTLEGIYSHTDVLEAKKKIIEAIEKSKISEEEKKQIFDWVNQDDVAFGPQEVDFILNTILEENDKAK